MPIEAFKHPHTLLVILFLLSYMYKTYLLLAGKKMQLAVYRKKTIAAEGVISLLFLVTGFYMLYIYGMEWLKVNWWMHIKLTLVFVGIPLGFIGFKRENVALAVLSTLSFLAVFILALINGSSQYL